MAGVSLSLIILLVLAIFLVWMSATMVLQMLFYVPFVPTPAKIGAAMLELAGLKPGDRVVELGAGDARLLIAASKRAKKLHLTGYEVSGLVWLLGRFRLWRTGVHAHLVWRDFRSADLRDADVLFAYLSPRMMRILEKKCANELKQGARVVSHAFPFPTKKPENVIRVMNGRRKTNVFLYQYEK